MCENCTELYVCKNYTELREKYTVVCVRVVCLSSLDICDLQVVSICIDSHNNRRKWHRECSGMCLTNDDHFNVVIANDTNTMLILFWHFKYYSNNFIPFFNSVTAGKEWERCSCFPSIKCDSVFCVKVRNICTGCTREGNTYSTEYTLIRLMHEHVCIVSTWQTRLGVLHTTECAFIINITMHSTFATQLARFKYTI